MVYRTIKGIIGHEETTADLVQEVFLKAVSRFETSQNFVPWLRSIAVRTAIDHLRRAKPIELPDTLPMADQDLDQRIMVEQTLAHLEPQDRAILNLIVGQQLSYQEVADTLQIPPGTVGSRLHHARQSFKHYWSKLWPEE